MPQLNTLRDTLLNGIKTEHEKQLTKEQRTQFKEYLVAQKISSIADPKERKLVRKSVAELKAEYDRYKAEITDEKEIGKVKELYKKALQAYTANNVKEGQTLFEEMKKTALPSVKKIQLPPPQGDSKAPAPDPAPAPAPDPAPPQGDGKGLVPAPAPADDSEEPADVKAPEPDVVQAGVYKSGTKAGLPFYEKKAIVDDATLKEYKENPDPDPSTTPNQALVDSMRSIDDFVDKLMGKSPAEQKKELSNLFRFITPSDQNGGIGTNKTNILLKGNKERQDRVLDAQMYELYDNTQFGNTNNNMIMNRYNRAVMIKRASDKVRMPAVRSRLVKNFKAEIPPQIQTRAEKKDFKPLINPPSDYSFGSPYSPFFHNYAHPPMQWGVECDNYRHNQNYFINA